MIMIFLITIQNTNTPDKEIILYTKQFIALET
jgi:hypothetical protein